MSGRITFSKSEPYHKGWQGWFNIVDIYLDGEKIGTLEGRGANKARMEYHVCSDVRTDIKTSAVSITGIKAAKDHVRKVVLGRPN